jgi:hypothetical protein
MKMPPANFVSNARRLQASSETSAAHRVRSVSFVTQVHWYAERILVSVICFTSMTITQQFEAMNMASREVSPSRFRRNASDLCGLFLFPLVVAALPWRIGLRVVKRLARNARTFRVEADAAWNVARHHQDNVDAFEWKERYRLLRWIERADTYLTLARSETWWRRHVDVVGEWPSPDKPGLFLTYHWGAGHWVWKLLHARGIRAYFLARRPVLGDLGISRVALWYGKLRAWGFSRIGSRGPLYTGGSTQRLRSVMADGESIVGMLDLPAQISQRPRRVTLLGDEAILPSRLIEIVKDDAAFIVLFSCGINFDSGRRELRIETLQVPLDVDSVLARYSEHLSARLREAPEYWMMWHEAEAIFVAPGSCNEVV